MVLKLPRPQKRILWVFEKAIFQFFANSWVTKLKPFSGKMRQSAQDYLSQNLAIGCFFGDSFEVALTSKMNVVSVLKEYFSVFCKFLSDEVENILRESDAKRSKLLKSKFGHRKLLRKWFWSYLSSKADFVSVWTGHFSVFWKFLQWGSWNHFLGNWGKAFKSI